MTQATIRFICTACSYRVRIPATYQGKVILCPKCQQVQFANNDTSVASGATVTVARVTTAPAEAVIYSVLDPQGKIRFSCKKCEFQAKIAGAYAGKAISCPGCKSPQIVPPLEGAPQAESVGTTPSGSVAKLPDQEFPTPTPHEPSRVVAPGSASRSGAKPPAALKSPSSSGKPASTSSGSSKEPSISVDEPFSDVAPLADGKSAVAATSPEAATPASDLWKNDEAADEDAADQPAKAPVKKPSTGAVVRRAGRAGAAWAAEEAEMAQEEAEAEVEAQEKRKKSSTGSALLRSKEIEAVSRKLENTIQPLRNPRTLTVVVSGAVIFILCIVFGIEWHSSLVTNDELNNAVKTLRTNLTTETDARNKADIKVGEQKNTLDQLQSALEKTKSDLNLSKEHSETLQVKLSRADSDFQQETTKFNQTADQLDKTTERLRKAVVERDESHQGMLDAQKARDEEARLRKELQIKYDEVLKLQK